MSKQHHLDDKCRRCSKTYDPSSLACQRTLESCDFSPIKRLAGADYTLGAISQDPFDRNTDFILEAGRYLQTHFGGLDKDSED